MAPKDKAKGLQTTPALLFNVPQHPSTHYIRTTTSALPLYQKKKRASMGRPFLRHRVMFFVTAAYLILSNTPVYMLMVIAAVRCHRGRCQTGGHERRQFRHKLGGDDRSYL